jgi:hypothetical protein
MSNVANKMVQAAAGNAGDILDTLLFGTYFGGKQLIALDVSDISNISDIGSRDVEGVYFSSSPASIDLTNKLLFLPAQNSTPYEIHTYNINNLSSMYKIDSFYTASPAATGSVADSVGEILYVHSGISSSKKLDKIDYSTPTALSRISQLTTSSYRTFFHPQLTSDGDTLFAITSSGNNAGSLKSYDVSGTNTSVLDTLDHSSGDATGGYLGLIWLEQDNYLASLNSNGYVKSFDVSDVNNLTLEDTLSLSNTNHAYRHTKAVDSVNKLLFVSGWTGTIDIVDVSDPTNLVYKNSIATQTTTDSSGYGFITVDPARKLAFCSFSSGSHVTKSYLHIINYSDIDNLTLTSIELQSINSAFAPSASLYNVGGGTFGFLFKEQ